MLLVGRHDLVLGGQAETGEHDRAAARRRIGQRDALRARRRARRRCPRARPRAARASRSKYSMPLRPFARSRSACSTIASTVARASGPFVPAFRYAKRSSTGNCARASSNVIRRGVLPARGRRGAGHRRAGAPSGQASGGVAGEPADEDLVDAVRQRRREAQRGSSPRRPRPADVRVAGDDRAAGSAAAANSATRCELLVGDGAAGRRGRSRRRRRPSSRTPWQMRRSPPLADDERARSLATRRGCARDEDRIRLAGERRAEQAVMQLGEPAAERARAAAARRPRRRAACRSSRRGARAPTPAPPAGRRRPGASARDELDHLAGGTRAAPAGALPWKRFQVRTSTPRSLRTRCGSSWQTRRRSRRRTTTSSRPRSRAPAPTSSSSRRTSASARRRPPTATPPRALLSRSRRALFRRSRAAAAAEGRRAPARPRGARARGAPTSCTCSGSSRSSTSACSARTRRPSSPRTTSCRGGRRASRTSGGGCSPASTASSCTASAAARRSRRSASTRA